MFRRDPIFLIMFGALLMNPEGSSSAASMIRQGWVGPRGPGRVDTLCHFLDHII